MTQPSEGLNGFHERLIRLEKGQELSTEKHEQANRKHDALVLIVTKMDNRLKWNEREVAEVKSDIKEIKGDTKWTRRTITGTLIGTLSTGILGGAIGIIWSVIGK